MNTSARDVAESLKKATEKLNGLIEEAEDALFSLEIGLPVEVQLGDEDLAEYKLSFQKYDREWRLVVIPPNGGKVILLRASPRRHRVAAAHALPYLVAALCDAEREEENEVFVAAQRLEAFLTEKGWRRPVEDPARHNDEDDEDDGPY